MTEHIFRMLERLQTLDTLLVRARRQRFADPIEIARLRARKLRIRGRLARLLPPAQPAY